MEGIRSLVFVLAFAACAAAPPLVEGSASSAQAVHLPVFPVWRASRTSPGTPAASVPTPDAAALLIAEGYLVAPYRPFRIELDEIGDPAVALFDGKRWVRGEVMHADRVRDIVLIRAEIGESPFELPDGAGVCGNLLVGIRANPIREGRVSIGSVPVASCRAGGKGKVCPADDAAPFIGGSALIRSDGRLCGLVTDPLLPILGSDTVPFEDLRRFIDLYFLSWGRHVEPKPRP